MDKMRFETPDMTEQNIDRIAALFPGCVTEMRGGVDGKVKRGINFEMLKQMLSPDVVDGSECYEFTWVGKRASIVEANKPIRKTLRPCPEESKDWDATENLYIEGDNLEVLKLLQEAYLGKVKMIYIDPPYNTGNDFIYADDFMRSQEEENEQMGMYDENENRLFKNTDSNGRFHSDWCSMMYSRLMLARNMLTENGAIFISIDDHEVDSLKKICDEIFGAINFVATFPWRKRTAKSDVPFGVSQDYEWVVCYAKSGAFLASVEGKERKYYETPDFPGRPWRVHDLTKQTTASERPNSFFTIINPKTGDKYPANPNRTWAITEDTFKEYYAVDRIVFPGDYDFLNIQKPVLRYWRADDMAKAGENFGRVPVSTKFPDYIGMSQDGTKETIDLLAGKVFSFPKPTSLVKFIAAIHTGANDIILDFFSGSATTAHAVMQLNAEERQSLERSIENLDKSDPDYHSKFQALSSQLSQTGKRKFIMVQLPEPCDEKSEAYKAGYQNICEIGKERIRRAGKQILERSLESLERDGMIEKIDKSKLPVLSSKNSPVESFEKEGVIEKYAGKLSEIRSLEEVYGSGGAGVSSHQTAAAGGDLRTGRSDAAGSGFDSVEYRGGTVAGNAGVYPVFESGKGITGGTGDTVVALRPLAVLNELGYRVCLERFRGNQQNALLSDQISKLQALNSKFSLDTGFRVLKLDDGNMKDVYYAADDYDQQNLVDMISNIKEDRTDLDLLFGCLLDWGLPLSLPYTSEQIDGCTVHTYNDGDLIACFDANIPESVVKKIAGRKPLRAVFRDSSFADSPAKINVFEIFKLYMPEDADDISKRVRVI